PVSSPLLPYTPLFRSEKWGRYSIIGLPARTLLKVHGHTASVQVDGVETECHECEDPLAFVEQFKARYRVPDVPGLPRFNGGLVGDRKSTRLNSSHVKS